jgi:hypothetical protein
MVAITKENGLKTMLKAMESIPTLTVNSMKVSGKKANHTVMAKKNGLMAPFSKECSKRGKKTVQAHSYSVTVLPTLENSKIV